jgi:PAS domain S-box-containing protein
MTRALIVDDKPDNLYRLRLVLQGHGCDVEEARHGAAALAKARQHPPDVVITDLHMPVMDGLTLLRQWKVDEQLKAIPFVVFTAPSTDPHDEKIALDLGADAFIVSPAEPEPFMMRVREVIERARRKDPTASAPPLDDRLTLNKDNEALVRKLEEKGRELEELNRRLAEREARLRAIVDTEPECVKLLAEDGSLLEMNPAGLRLIEADSFQQVANQSLYPLVAEEHRAAFRQLTEEVFRGESGTLEFRITGLRGGGHWLETHATPLRDATGAITALLGVTRDVTARKQAEQAVRESERQLTTLISNLPGYVYRVANDPDYTPLFVSEGVERTTGYAQREYLVDRTITCGAEIHPEDRDAVWRTVQQAVAVREPFECQYRIHAKSGEMKWVSERGRGIFGPTGDLLFLEGFVTDITERQRTEADLREAQDRLKLAASAGNVGLWDWDLRAGTAHFSSEWKQQIGYGDDEISDDVNEWKGRVHPDDLNRALAIQQACRSSEKAAFEVEFRLRHKDGSYRHILSRGSALLDDDGMPIRLVGSHVDITEWTELQAQFLQSQKMDSVGQLAGGIAHDFNNLLTVINGTADLVLSDLKAWDPLRADLQQIREAGDRAAALTRQLLAFSRKQIMTPDVLDLNVVVSDMQRMLERLIGEHIELVIMPAKNLSSVRADPGQIEQVIMNLAVNARDAMPKGGALTIQTENVELDAAYAFDHPSVQPGPHVMLAVSDTGVGMDEPTRRRIFEPFFTTKGPARGTGLGLSTAYGIVKQSGGSIWVYSALGQGTTFKIYLPQVKETAHTARPARPTTARGTETVLIVEDDASVRQLAARFLQSAGYAVITAGSGAEALLVLKGEDGPVHLMLTDVVMPGMTGRELAERLASIHPLMKVIYTSGYTDDTILRHGVIDHAAHFIGKPYSMAELSTKVREVLG